MTPEEAVIRSFTEEGIETDRVRMVQIWKYALHPYKQKQMIEMPRGSFLLTVGTQPYYNPMPAVDDEQDPRFHHTYRLLGEVMYLWVMVDPKEPIVAREICVVETGVSVSNEDLAMLVGAVRLHGNGNNYVAHVFDAGREHRVEGVDPL